MTVEEERQLVSTESEEDMGQLLDQAGEIKSVRRGDVVEGYVMRADTSDGLFVNIGQKSEAQVPANEMRSVETEDIESLVGGSIIAMVVVLRLETTRPSCPWTGRLASRVGDTSKRPWRPARS